MWYRTVGGIVTLMLSLLTAPLTSQAQPAAHVPRLGLLMPGSASGYASRLEAFRHGLRDLGYVEGHNITLEYRFAEGQADRLPSLVAELVRLPVDVLVVDGTVAQRELPRQVDVEEEPPQRRVHRRVQRLQITQQDLALGAVGVPLGLDEVPRVADDFTARPSPTTTLDRSRFAPPDSLRHHALQR